MSGGGARLRLLAWLVGLLAVLLALRATAGGSGPPSPASGAEAWSAWTDARGAAGVVMWLLRVCTEAAGWYLLSTTLLALIATGRGGAARLGRDHGPARATPACVRRLVAAAAGVSLSAGALTSVAAATPSAGYGRGAAVTTTPAATPDVVMRRLPDDDPPHLRRLAERDEETLVGARVATWTLRPGDHLWRVAEETLAREWERRPSDRETAAYWRVVIERNRAGLPDPANPDLVFPGGVITLPPPPPRPSS